MDLDQLQAVRDRERDSERLQELRGSFYADATSFVGQLRDEREQAARAAEDPFDDPTVNRLTDRIRTAEGTIEAIYEKRVGKILRAATLAAADLSTDIDGMTREEERLFESLVEEIQANRREVLGPVADQAGDADPPADADAPTGTPGSGDQDPADDSSSDASDRPPDADDSTGAAGDDGDQTVDRTLVRITSDVGAILGVDDREYDLAEDDVVTLPTANAEPLVERGAAERLE